MNEEVVLFRGSPSLLLKAGTFFVGIILIIAFVVAAILFHQPLVAIGAAIVLVYLFSLVALIRSNVFEVTSERVRWRRGILTKRTDDWNFIA